MTQTSIYSLFDPAGDESQCKKNWLLKFGVFRHPKHASVVTAFPHKYPSLWRVTVPNLVTPSVRKKGRNDHLGPPSSKWRFLLRPISFSFHQTTFSHLSIYSMSLSWMHWPGPVCYKVGPAANRWVCWTARSLHSDGFIPPVICR